MHSITAAIVGLATVAGGARAQCSDWADEFHPGGPTGPAGAIVRALASFDEAAQARLAFGGAFSQVGEVAALNVAAWDGQQWSALGAGFDGQVRALAVFDDGAGEKLYAAGDFTHSGSTTANHIAWWDGANWNPLGTGLNNDAYALAVYDDGAGPALYVAGVFSNAGGVACSRIARWRNGAWSALGNPGGGSLLTLTTADLGGGERLFAGGTHIVGAWDGTSWTQVAANFTGQVRALAEFDDGGGPALYATGSFAQIDGILMLGAARWTGTAWQSLPGNPGLSGEALAVFDDGGGPGLHFGFTTAAPVKRFRNGMWTDVGGTFSSGNSVGGSVVCYGTFDDGTTERLFVGGDFDGCDGASLWSIAQLDAGKWQPPSTDGEGLDGETYSLKYGDLGEGPRVFVSGAFSTAGGAYARHVAQWDGAHWDSVGAGFFGSVPALAMHDDGTGETLFAGGVNLFGQTPDAVARWNGTDWELVPGLKGTSFFHGGVQSMASFDVGSEHRLYVAGDMVNNLAQPGQLAAGYLAWWNGSQWQFVPTHQYGSVSCVETLDFQGSRSLYAAGLFTSIDGVAAEQIARFDGVQWSPVGPPLGLPQDSGLSALAVHDDGSGPALYAAGVRRFAINSVEFIVVKFDGSTWTDVGAWPGFIPRAMVSFDDGDGQGLFVAASAWSLAPDARLKVWRNGVWSNVPGAATDNSGDFMGPLLITPDASSPNGVLWVGGRFTNLGAVDSRNIARYVNGCACDATTYCTSGTTSSGCTPTIGGVGRASATLATPFSIELTQLEGARTGHIFYGMNGPHGSPWGTSSHFLCVKGPSQRTPTQSTGGVAGACDGAMTLDWNSYVNSHPATLGAPFAAGDVLWAQAYFRDPAGPKTTALSNGLQFTICP